MSNSKLKETLFLVPETPNVWIDSAEPEQGLLSTKEAQSVPQARAVVALHPLLVQVEQGVELLSPTVLIKPPRSQQHRTDLYETYTRRALFDLPNGEWESMFLTQPPCKELTLWFSLIQPPPHSGSNLELAFNAFTATQEPNGLTLGHLLSKLQELFRDATFREEESAPLRPQEYLLGSQPGWFCKGLQIGLEDVVLDTAKAVQNARSVKESSELKGAPMEGGSKPAKLQPDSVEADEPPGWL